MERKLLGSSSIGNGHNELNSPRFRVSTENILQTTCCPYFLNIATHSHTLYTL